MAHAVQKVVEIARAADESLPEDLILDTFGESRRELIVLVLNGVDAPRINKILDPVARDAPMSMPGVLYVGIGDERRIAEALASARTVVAATEGFRAMVLGLGYALGPAAAPNAPVPHPAAAAGHAAPAPPDEPTALPT